MHGSCFLLPLGHGAPPGQRRHLGGHRGLPGHLLRQRPSRGPRASGASRCGFRLRPDVRRASIAEAAEHAVVARLTSGFPKPVARGLRYDPVNRDWEMADFEHRSHGWTRARRFVVARRFPGNRNPTDPLLPGTLSVSRLGHHPPRLLQRASGISMTLARPWSAAFGSCARTTPSGRSPPGRLRLTLFTWKSSAWPITCHRLSTNLLARGMADPHLEQATPPALLATGRTQPS